MHENKQEEICENIVKIWASLRIIYFNNRQIILKKSYTDFFFI